MDALVAHYSEVGLKGHNRGFFEETLRRNLAAALRGTGYGRIRSGFGRFVVDFPSEGAAPEEAAERASRVLGLAYVGLGRRVVDPSLGSLGEAALELLGGEELGSFRVRARRAYSSFPQTSQEINEAVGRQIKEATGAPVNLKAADTTVWVELFAGAAIVYCRRLEGPGGLPARTSAKMLALLSGGIDSPVAAWRMARRGADVELVHFHSRPFTDASSIRQATALAELLARYQPKALLHLVPLGEIQSQIASHCPPPLRVVLYRRAMVRIAATLADERKARALVMGDSLGQVASQTIGNMAVVDAAVPGIQILRPLIGMNKQEIVDDAKLLGTYDISTRKYQDCCVLFQPRSPSTNVRAAEAEEAEEPLDVPTLVKGAVAETETRVLEQGSL